MGPNVWYCYSTAQAGRVSPVCITKTEGRKSNIQSTALLVKRFSNVREKRASHTFAHKMDFLVPHVRECLKERAEPLDSRSIVVHGVSIIGYRANTKTSSNGLVKIENICCFGPGILVALRSRGSCRESDGPVDFEESDEGTASWPAIEPDDQVVFARPRLRFPKPEIEGIAAVIPANW